MDLLDRELELRAHIRSLLLPYALTHLATDYVAWTQERVGSLLSESLSYVPMVCPTSVALPVDPFQTLSDMWSLPKLDVYEERWKLNDTETVSHLRRALPISNRGQGPAEQRWQNADDGDYVFFLLERPLSPILTARAVRETPRPGSTTKRRNLPQSTAQLLRFHGISATESIEVPDPVVNLDDALGSRPAFDADARATVLRLLQSVPTMATPANVQKRQRPFDDFLRASSPPIDFPEPEMLPVFSRDSKPGRKVEHEVVDGTTFATYLGGLTSLSTALLAPVEVKEESDNDMADENLKLIDGCDAIKTPSSPFTMGTPSLADTSSEIDELFVPSSSLPCPEEFMPIDDYQLPRNAKIGGSNMRRPLLGEGSKLSSFLSPLLTPANCSGPRVLCSPKSQPSSPRITTTMSMLGQPPSTDDPGAISYSRSEGHVEVGLSSDDSISAAIKTVKRVCGDASGDVEDPVSIILDEKLGEKDSMLMDVPKMRPPNEYTSSDCLPSRLGDLLAPGQTPRGATLPPGVTSSGIQQPCTGFLKKAKGVQPLQIELSWIPFKYGRTVPTDEEVADVANDPCPELSRSIDLSKDEIVARLTALMDESKVFSSQPVQAEGVPSTKAWLDDEVCDASPGFYEVPAMKEFGLILTRGDRRRLYDIGSPPFIEEEEDTGSSDKENEFLYGYSTVTGNEKDHDSRTTAKRVRFEDHYPDSEQFMRNDISMHQADDSGVYFVQEDVASGSYNDRSSSFVQLGSDAEGYEGHPGDGDLFLDMHPVHCDGRGPLSHSQELLYETYIYPEATLLSPSPSDSRTDRNESLSHARDMAAEHLPSTSPSGHEVLLMGPACGQSSGPETLTTLATLGLRRSPTANTAVRPGPFPQPGIPVFSVRQSLAHLLRICGKGLLLETPSASANYPASSGNAVKDAPPPALPAPDDPSTHLSVPRDTPEELVDNRTLVLPADYEPPSAVHRYIASLNLIERGALARALRSYCAVDLVEREYLDPKPDGNGDDVHLIIDCDTAVLFFSLELLPTRSDALATLLAQLSWRYTRLLVIFECYSSTLDYKRDSGFAGRFSGADTDANACRDRPTASAWSPPVVKAVRKLRRALAIAEGIQTKSDANEVHWTFADTVEEAAVYARMYGDMAEASDTTHGAIWGERTWLGHEERDGEHDLSGVEGMNLFTAALILSQITLEDFLEKSAGDRLLEFGNLVGSDRIARFNVEMTQRLAAIDIELPPSSPIAVDADSSSSVRSVPYLRDSEM